MPNSTSQKFLFYGFAVVLVLRLLMVFTMGIMPQDAYYFYYSEHPSLSYFDHPPGVAMMLWLFIKLLGTAVWSLKLTDFIVTCGTLWLIYILSGNYLSEARRRNLVFVFGSTLIITDVSIVTTPDVPLLLFWTFALIVLYKAIRRPDLSTWVLAGVIAGLAFDSKYTAVFIPTGLFCYLLLSKQYRRYLLSWQFPVFLIMFAIATLPVVIWNVEHDFASFKFQSGDRVASMLEFKLRPVYFIAVIGHQMALLLPILAIAMGVVFWKHIKKTWRRRRLPDDDTLFLLSFSLPMILTFLGISWLYWVKINWMIPAYITASILVMRYLQMRWMKWQMWIAVIATMLLLIQIAFYPINIQSDDTYWGWKKLATEVTLLQKQYPNHFIFSRDGYKTTAVLNFYLDEKIYAANVLGEHALEYSIIDHDLSHLKGKAALFIDSRRRPSEFDSEYVPYELLSVYFDSITVLQPITLSDKRGKRLRQFAVVECWNYLGEK